MAALPTIQPLLSVGRLDHVQRRFLPREGGSVLAQMLLAALSFPINGYEARADMTRSFTLPDAIAAEQLVLGQIRRTPRGLAITSVTPF